MADILLQQKIYPYDGQQDSTRNPLLISPKDIVDSNNIVYTTYSTKKLRPGITPLLTSPRPVGNHILSSIDFWRLGQQRVVYWDGQSIWAVNPSTQTSVNISGGLPLPVDEVVTFLAFQGLLLIFFSGGQTPIKAWTMTGNIYDMLPADPAAAPIPNAPFGRVFLNSLWIPDPTIPGRMMASVPGTPNDFTSAGAQVYDLDINDGDPDGITAIFPPFFSSLYVTKRLSIFRGTPQILADGTLVIPFIKISDGVGCISHNGVIAAESQIFFPSDWGWHTFESTTKISAVDTSLLSLPIQPIWTADTNFARSQYITGLYDRDLNSLIIMFPAAAYNFATDVWGYSITAQKWYRWSEFNHTSMCRYVDQVTKKLRTLVFSDTGQIGYLDKSVTTDYGEKFGCQIVSGIIAPAGSPDDAFHFNYMAPIFVPQLDGEFTITYKLDGVVIETLTFSMRDTSLGDALGVDFITGVSVLGGVPTVKINKVRTEGTGMFYQLFIEYTPKDREEAGVGFEMLGILMDVISITKSVGERIA